MNNLATQLATWRTRIDAHVTITDDTPTLADLQHAADVAEAHATRARQAVNRAAAYTRRRPSRYAAASYDTLRTEQDPRGLVTAWWQRGPRALVIAGPARTGKTTAAYAIANDAHGQGEWVMVWTAADLSAALKPDGEPLAFEYATTCPLLVLDDLGRERVTDWWLEQLQRIVDLRCAHERRLIVTTNTAPAAGGAYEELVARYGDPIVERLIDDGGVVVLDGPAVRRVVTDW